MAPWFAAMEQRLHVGLWPIPPNENNAVLARGGIAVHVGTAGRPTCATRRLTDPAGRGTG